MGEPIMFAGHVLAKPRKFKKVAGTNKENKEGTTGPGGELQEFAWKLVVAFLADCPRALVPLYSCSTGLHAMVVDMQDEALPSTLDAATAHLVKHEVSQCAYPALIDPSDEFGDVSQCLEEKIQEYEEACLAKGLEARIYGRDRTDWQREDDLREDDFGFVKTVDPRLVRACAATLPAWPSLPSWVTEDSTNADKVFSPRPLGRAISPVQMHKDTDENGDEVCVFQVRYFGEKPEPIATRDEDSEKLCGEMKIFAPEWWLHYLALRILEPRGYVMNGRIAWVGCGNAGLIEVIDNRVDVFPLGQKYDHYYCFPRGLLRYASKHKLLPLWGLRVNVSKLDIEPGTLFDVATLRQTPYGKNCKIVLPGLGEQETRQIVWDFRRQPFAEYMEETLPRLLRYPEFFSTIDNGSKLVAKLGPYWRLEFALPMRRPRKKARTEDDADASRSESDQDGAKDAGTKKRTSQSDVAKHSSCNVM